MLGSVSFGSVRGGVIISGSAVIILLVCSCSPSADMILVKALGLGMALAVALDATLVRGLLVPATMRLLGNLNWWLPFVGVQRHPPALENVVAALVPPPYMNHNPAHDHLCSTRGDGMRR